jgi:hypothetical protein
MTLLITFIQFLNVLKRLPLCISLEWGKLIFDESASEL